MKWGNHENGRERGSPQKLEGRRFPQKRFAPKTNARTTHLFICRHRLALRRSQGDAPVSGRPGLRLQRCEADARGATRLGGGSLCAQGLGWVVWVGGFGGGVDIGGLGRGGWVLTCLLFGEAFWVAFQERFSVSLYRCLGIQGSKRSSLSSLASTRAFNT